MKLPSVGLPLNASKLESMLICGVRLPSHENRNKCKWLRPNVARSLLPVEGIGVERCPHHGTGKSWTDDPVNLGIVGAESGLCATIH